MYHATVAPHNCLEGSGSDLPCYSRLRLRLVLLFARRCGARAGGVNAVRVIELSVVQEVRVQLDRARMPATLEASEDAVGLNVASHQGCWPLAGCRSSSQARSSSAGRGRLR